MDVGLCSCHFWLIHVGIPNDPAENRPLLGFRQGQPATPPLRPAQVPARIVVLEGRDRREPLPSMGRQGAKHLILPWFLILGSILILSIFWCRNLRSTLNRCVNWCEISLRYSPIIKPPEFTRDMFPTCCLIILTVMWFNVGKWENKVINYPPAITIFCAMFIIPSHGWFMALFWPYQSSETILIKHIY